MIGTLLWTMTKPVICLALFMLAVAVVYLFVQRMKGQR